MTSNDDRDFLRQIHPNCINKQGVVASNQFEPRPNDALELSVDASWLTTPEVSFEFYTKSLGLVSAGVWAIPVSTVDSEQDLSWKASPVPESPTRPGNNAHHSIVFPTDDTSHKTLSKRLRNAARKLYSP